MITHLKRYRNFYYYGTLAAIQLIQVAFPEYGMAAGNELLTGTKRALQLAWYILTGLSALGGLGCWIAGGFKMTKSERTGEGIPWKYFLAGIILFSGTAILLLTKDNFYLDRTSTERDFFNAPNWQ